MVDLHFWEFPLNLIVAVAFVAALLLCALTKRYGRVLNLLCSPKFAGCLLFVVAMVIAVEGTWKPGLYHHWMFVSLLLLLLFTLGLAVIRNFRHATPLFLLSHSGIFVLVFAGLFGSSDISEGQIVVSRDRADHVAFSRTGEAVPLPFDIQLEQFRVEYYDNSQAPKQYLSKIRIADSLLETSVNNPCSSHGYSIYQSDFDHDNLRYSVLKVVRDPWLPLVYLGFILLALSAFMQINSAWTSRAILPITLVLTLVFGFISVYRINFGTLPPALRSLWFVPHLIVYMIAYSLMAISLVCAFLSLFWSRASTSLARSLLSSSSALLLIGMLCGAVWAKAAWGDYWTWDAKECWAAVTWILTLVGSHLPMRRERSVAFAVLVLVCFLSIQITWYGVNYLPAAKESLHTYNK